MSIFPATDIVSDVAKAADPKKLDVAMKRLSELSAARLEPAQSFSAIVASTARRAADAPAVSRIAPQVAGLAPSPREISNPAAAAAQKFEAYVLQTWLEALLPKQEGGSFGSGGAGGVWRSMMAEQLGAQLARAGGVGLHKLFDKDHQLTAASRDITPTQG